MRVLVSNDDGVDAPGLRVLADRLGDVGEVTIVAPDRDRSGASNSLTLDAPIRVVKLDETGSHYAPPPAPVMMRSMAQAADSAPTPVTAGDVEVRVSVTLHASLR